MSSRAARAEPLLELGRHRGLQRLSPSLAQHLLEVADRRTGARVPLHGGVPLTTDTVEESAGV